MNQNNNTVKDFKERVKEYEKTGTNAKVLKQLTVKDRLAVSEMSNMIVLGKIAKLETWRKIHEMVMIVLGLAVLILTFTKG